MLPGPSLEENVLGVGVGHRVINYKKDKATQIVFDRKFHEFLPGWVISTIAVRCL